MEILAKLDLNKWLIKGIKRQIISIALF